VRPDPYLELAQKWPAVKVRIRHDMGTDAGATLWLPDETIEIHLAHNLTRVERRCTLSHEIMHIRRGKPPFSRDQADEAAVIRDTARWLIPDLSEFAESLAAEDVSTAAKRFDVINAIIYERLDHLTKFEMEHVTGGLKAHVRERPALAAADHLRGTAK
jgi:hypothetical protein